jgi:hypothetical protein
MTNLRNVKQQIKREVIKNYIIVESFDKYNHLSNDSFLSDRDIYCSLKDNTDLKIYYHLNDDLKYVSKMDLLITPPQYKLLDSLYL